MLKVIYNRMSRFCVLKPAREKVGMERRRSHRLYTNLPVEYRLVLADQVSRFASWGMMKNISQGGAYLEVDAPPGLIQGQVAHFTFISLSGTEDAATIRLAAKGVIRRIDRPKRRESRFGLAVEFLSGPLICFNNREALTN
jgi:hypothetical protein